MSEHDDLGVDDNSPWWQVVQLVTSQPDWDEEWAEGPDDIIAYIRDVVRRPTTSRVRMARKAKRKADQEATVLRAERDDLRRRLDDACAILRAHGEVCSRAGALQVLEAHADRLDVPAADPATQETETDR